MKKWIISTGIACLICMAWACSSVQQSADYRVVPLPNEIVSTMGEPFRLDNQVKILYPENNPDMQRNAAFLAEYVKESTGRTLAVAPGTEGTHAIVLQLGLDVENPEAYRMEVNANQVTIAAASPAGVFYGIQTLRKSLPVGQEGEIVLPPVTMCGALTDYITDRSLKDFQPMGASFGLLPPLDEKIRDKKMRYEALAKRALAVLDEIIDQE